MQPTEETLSGDVERFIFDDLLITVLIDIRQAFKASLGAVLLGEHSVVIVKQLEANGFAQLSPLAREVNYLSVTDEGLDDKTGVGAWSQCNE